MVEIFELGRREIPAEPAQPSMRDFYLATSGTSTWPPAGTFSWPRTIIGVRHSDYVR